MSYKTYSYVGNDGLRALVAGITDRAMINRASDVLTWVQKANAKHEVTITFVIDLKCRLWIADRHSEHIVCAHGDEVLSAGELTFQIENGQVSVSDVSNQSTGYCPEPSSWPAVVAALDNAGISRPEDFTRAFTFRLCKNCGQRNIVKEEDFACGVCGTELEQEWNF